MKFKIRIHQQLSVFLKATEYARSIAAENSKYELNEMTFYNLNNCIPLMDLSKV